MRALVILAVSALMLCLVVGAFETVHADEPNAWRVPCEGRTDTFTVVTGVAAWNNLIACGGDDHCVRVFTKNGKLIHTLKGHRSWVKAVAFSSDGRYLASAGDCSHIIVWDAHTGEVVHRFSCRPGKARSIAFCGCHNGDVWFAVGLTNNDIRVYCVSGRKLVHALTGHKGTVSALAYNPRYSTLVSGSYDTTVRVWFINRLARWVVNGKMPQLTPPMNQRSDSDKTAPQLAPTRPR